ncbi:MAG: hypothetical protein JKX72_03475 [Robiginitomaculum sp.]|nr:hypothetical protein [Robiginitomaculum sp.]
MTVKLTTGLFILGIAASISYTALASPHAHKADTDKNGEISQTEFNQIRNQRFIAIDTNTDGLLSVDERKAYKEAQKQDRRDRRFSRLDGNGDGSISRLEFDTSATKNSDKKRGHKMRKHIRKQMIQNPHKPDTNQDGFIDRAEFDAQAAKIFARRDANHDGVLSKADREFRKHRFFGHN